MIMTEDGPEKSLPLSMQVPSVSCKAEAISKKACYLTHRSLTRHEWVPSHSLSHPTHRVEGGLAPVLQQHASPEWSPGVEVKHQLRGAPLITGIFLLVPARKVSTSAATRILINIWSAVMTIH
jgi:hypothetical protein